MESATHSPLLGMVLLEKANSLQMEEVILELRNIQHLEVDDTESDADTTVLIIDGYTIAIAQIPVPIPGEDIKSAAQFNYFWKNGVQEAPQHKAHLIVSIIDAGKDAIQENLLYCKVASAVLNHSKSLGIYLGGRSLLLKKDFYLANTKEMSKEDLPLYNWVYFGLRTENGKQSVYTYGLSDFNKQEMEIVNSTHSLTELEEMMYNLSHYVLEQDVVLQDGETIGMSAEQKLKISESEGQFLEGKTLKIAF